VLLKKIFYNVNTDANFLKTDGIAKQLNCLFFSANEKVSLARCRLNKEDRIHNKLPVNSNAACCIRVFRFRKEQVIDAFGVKAYNMIISRKVKGDFLMKFKMS